MFPLYILTLIMSQVTFNGNTTVYSSTSGTSRNGMSFELSRVTLTSGQVFPLSVQVENELGNSTEVETTVIVLSECLRTSNIAYVCS